MKFPLWYTLVKLLIVPLKLALYATPAKSDNVAADLIEAVITSPQLEELVRVKEPEPDLIEETETI